MIIISDTSPVSNLIQIDRLHILQELFGEINIPSFVDIEIQQLKKFTYNLSNYLQADWINIYSPTDTAYINILEQELDRGEAEAIALYQQLNANLLLEQRVESIKSQLRDSQLLSAEKNSLIAEMREKMSQRNVKSRE